MKALLPILSSVVLLGMFALPSFAEEGVFLVEGIAVEECVKKCETPEMVEKLLTQFSERYATDEENPHMVEHMKDTQASWLAYVASMQHWARLLDAKQVDALTDYLYKQRVTEILQCYEFSVSEETLLSISNHYQLGDVSATEEKYKYVEKEGEKRAEGSMVEMKELSVEIAMHYQEKLNEALTAREQAVLASDLPNKKELAEAVNVAAVSYFAYLNNCRRGIASQKGSVWPLISAVVWSELLIGQLHTLDTYFPLPAKS